MNNTHPSQSFTPALMCQLDISEPIPPLTAYRPYAENYERAIVLVLLFGKPIDVIEVMLSGQDMIPADVAATIWTILSGPIKARLKKEALLSTDEIPLSGLSQSKVAQSLIKRRALLKESPRVTVVVATHNRLDGLKRCLDSLLNMEYPNFDIIVVDNAPSNSDTAAYIIENFPPDSKVSYVYEPNPGLAIAHNAGLREVTAPIVAFTDDDVIVNRDWLTHIVAAFVYNQHVGCVTGMIWPAEMETPAQELIEQYGGFSKGFSQKHYDLEENRPSDLLYPYTAGKFGSGANMAFNTAVLKELGGFDPALGAGSQGMGGDDLAAFYQIVAANYTLVYEPAAIIHHWHYREYGRLQKTAFGYGVGLTAYLTSTLIKKPTRLLQLLIKAPLGIAYALSPKSDKNKQKKSSYPYELTQIERQGMLKGPLAYLQSWWKTRHLQFDRQLKVVK
jgi:GT2 family glycosyltransferase